VVTLLIVSMMFRRGSGAIAMPQPIAHPTPRPMRMQAAREEFDDQDDQEQEDAALMRQVRELAGARPDETARVLRDWIRQG
jgi:flagellar biosynthesis/type III secretory pathway M-ring protein FliF/YscJ